MYFNCFVLFRGEHLGYQCSPLQESYDGGFARYHGGPAEHVGAVNSSDCGNHNRSTGHGRDLVSTISIVVSQSVFHLAQLCNMGKLLELVDELGLKTAFLSNQRILSLRDCIYAL